MFKLSVLAFSLASLASCGGDSGSDDYQMTLDQAHAQEAQAFALAATSPCDALPQCGILVLHETSGYCTSLNYRAYSLVSSTAAAASAAAAEERGLADRAANLSPPSACPASIRLPPGAACVANACQVALPQ